MTKLPEPAPQPEQIPDWMREDEEDVQDLMDRDMGDN
jgi:hypothetical protein